MGILLGTGVIGGYGDEEENFWDGLFESISDVSKGNRDVPISAANGSIESSLYCSSIGTFFVIITDTTAGCAFLTALTIKSS